MAAVVNATQPRVILRLQRKRKDSDVQRSQFTSTAIPPKRSTGSKMPTFKMKNIPNFEESDDEERDDGTRAGEVNEDADAYIDVVGLSGDQEEAIESSKKSDSKPDAARSSSGEMAVRSGQSVHPKSTEFVRQQGEQGEDANLSVTQSSNLPCCSTSEQSHETDSNSPNSRPKRFIPMNPKLEQDADIIFLGSKEPSESFFWPPMVKQQQQLSTDLRPLVLTDSNGRASVSSPAISSTTADMNSEVLAEMMQKIDKLYEQLQELQGQGGLRARTSRGSPAQRDFDSHPSFRGAGIEAELLMNDSADCDSIDASTVTHTAVSKNSNSSSSDIAMESDEEKMGERSISEDQTMRETHDDESPPGSSSTSSFPCVSLTEREPQERSPAETGSSSRAGKRVIADPAVGNVAAKSSKRNSINIADDDDALDRLSETISIISSSPGTPAPPSLQIQPPPALSISEKQNPSVLPQSLPTTPLFSPLANVDSFAPSTTPSGSSSGQEMSAQRRRARSLTFDPNVTTAGLGASDAVQGLDQAAQQTSLSQQAHDLPAATVRGNDLLQMAFNSAMVEQISVNSTSDSCVTNVPQSQPPIFRAPLLENCSATIPPPEKGRAKPRRRRVAAAANHANHLQLGMPTSSNPLLVGNPSMHGAQMPAHQMPSDHSSANTNSMQALQQQFRAALLPERAVIVQPDRILTVPVEQPLERGMNMAPGNSLGYSAANPRHPGSIHSGANVPQLQREIYGKVVFSSGSDESLYNRQQIPQAAGGTMYCDERLLSQPMNGGSPSVGPPRLTAMMAQTQVIATQRPNVMATPRLSAMIARPPQNAVMINGNSSQFSSLQIYGQPPRAMPQPGQVMRQPIMRGNAQQSYTSQPMVPALSAAPFIVGQSQPVMTAPRMHSPYSPQQVPDCARASSQIGQMPHLHPPVSSLMKESSHVLCVPQAETISFPPGVEKTITKVRNTACPPSPEPIRDRTLPRKAPDHNASSLPLLLSAPPFPKVDYSNRPCNSWSIVTLQLPTKLHIECDCFHRK